MKIKVVITIASAFLSYPALAVTISVPGTSDPWLAGMPNGSTASQGDVAPAQSPVLVTGISIVGGSYYSFQASGAVAQGPGYALQGPDGLIGNYAQHNYALNTEGPEHGIGDVSTPTDALIGVFLGPGMPDPNATPVPLDFSSSASRDYLTLSPLLQQPFFIGDGSTSLGVLQQVLAPNGATRLFLGTMDFYLNSDNPGSFTVVVVPEPSGMFLASIGLTGLRLYRRIQRPTPATLR